MKDKDLPEIANNLLSSSNADCRAGLKSICSMKTKDLLKFLPEDIDFQKVFETQTVDEAVRLARKISSPTRYNEPVIQIKSSTEEIFRASRTGFVNRLRFKNFLKVNIFRQKL